MTFIHPAEEGMDFGKMKKILDETIEQDEATESKIDGALKFLRSLKSNELVELQTKEETVKKPASTIIKYLEAMEDTDDPSDFTVSLVEDKS